MRLEDFDNIQDELRCDLMEIRYCELSDLDDVTKFPEMGLDPVLAAEFLTMIRFRYGPSEEIEAIYD
jgi:hypothetical protein